MTETDRDRDREQVWDGDKNKRNVALIIPKEKVLDFDEEKKKQQHFFYTAHSEMPFIISTMNSVHVHKTSETISNEKRKYLPLIELAIL